LSFISHTAVKYVHFILATAILDFWRMLTTRDTGSDPIKMFDPENLGIAVGILLLCALELEICLGGIYPPAAGKRRQKTAAGTRVKACTVRQLCRHRWHCLNRNVWRQCTQLCDNLAL